MRETTKPSDYIAIEIWGRRLGSYANYIENQQLQAYLDVAPADAIYKGSDSKQWQTVSGLSQHHEFREEYAKALKARGMDELEAWKDLQ